MKSITTIALAIFFGNIMAYGQIDTINAVNNTLNIAKLKEGKVAYSVYFTDSAFNFKGAGDIWERTTRFSVQNDRKIVEFDWKWYHGDSLLAHVTNYMDRQTLAPLFHKAVSKRGTIAYDYAGGYMVPSQSIENNAAMARSKVKMDIPIISWEQDLETYPLLPIKKIGQKFDIAFFDPNEKAPTYHRYEVVGKEILEMNADTKASCWLLKSDSGNGNYSLFWLTEKSKEVVKMKEFYNGRYRFKVRLY